MLWTYFTYSCILLVLNLSHCLSKSLIPPIVDISALIQSWNHTEAEMLNVQKELVAACEQWGFFHITNHGISSDLQSSLLQEMGIFFNSSKELKYTVKRQPNNSRGFADDELTKQIVDSKEIFDIGQVHFENLSEKATENQNLDGVNFWPVAEHLNNFKPVMDAYYTACLNLSSVLYTALTAHLSCNEEVSSVVSSAFDTHSSFLRLNMYPLTPAPARAPKQEVSINPADGSIEYIVLPAENGDKSTKLGISRHTDAGVLTLLLQDEHPALEVYSGSKQDFNDGEWVPVNPVAGAITVNTGDMLQVLSNGRFKAPEHRVRASQTAVRYSAPFFFNPAYDTVIAPIVCVGEGSATKQEPRYSPIRWGDYRAQRFAGDYADVGEEIQIEVFGKQKQSFSIAI